jgi:hypothetical protein
MKSKKALFGAVGNRQRLKKSSALSVFIYFFLCCQLRMCLCVTCASC